ncbi:MAG TPA: hypothetical protein PLB05_05360 [Candidatus Omnitrophota bacterium]|nr:hypothetical protein [Candidatus Omnitrophota bacterium]HPN55884.1 hypothetical protein [Candidatus Omnitrophota bacterium]
MKKHAVNDNTMFISHDEATIIARPSEGSFNLPAAFVPAQFSAILASFSLVVFTIWADELDTTLEQAFPQWIAVISFVSDDPFGFLLWATTPRTRNRNFVQRRFKKLRFARARRVQVEPRRNSLAVDHHHPLRAFAAFGLSNARAPFLAAAKLPSANASLQSICSRSSNSDNKARQAVNQLSCSSHSRSLRQHVDAIGNSFGISGHSAPVRRIQRMPSKTFRLSALGRPPFCSSSVRATTEQF